MRGLPAAGLRGGEAVRARHHHDLCGTGPHRMPRQAFDDIVAHALTFLDPLREALNWLDVERNLGIARLMQSKSCRSIICAASSQAVSRCAVSSEGLAVGPARVWAAMLRGIRIG
jgi:hypothetical protein